MILLLLVSLQQVRAPVGIPQSFRNHKAGFAGFSFKPLPNSVSNGNTSWLQKYWLRNVKTRIQIGRLVVSTGQRTCKSNGRDMENLGMHIPNRTVKINPNDVPWITSMQKNSFWYRNRLTASPQRIELLKMLERDTETEEILLLRRYKKIRDSIF